ncbi:SAM-dependent methyltransferase [Nocardia abscessus]|uniref:SAM-dependent methyltransferase n=1 Tax=Nocardia abscessus TaxID=120957 RepID=UPI0024565FEF|nr:SAM-dependent methyltransferase [Nocardia abscessus]
MSKHFNPYRAHSGRIHDYLLGGKDQYAVDRDAGERIVHSACEYQVAARAARAFLIRAVRHLAAERGVEQFVELGSGYPCPPNVHEVAQSCAPAARTLYVDNDPVVAAHGRALLADDRNGAGQTRFVHADVIDTATIAGEMDGFLDLGDPIAICLGAVLEFVEDPRCVVHELVGTLPAGSYVVISHITDEFDTEIVERAAAVYASCDIAFWPRTRDEVTRILAGCELIEPGLVAPHRWRPDDELEQRRAQQLRSAPAPSTDICCYAAVGRVP